MRVSVHLFSFLREMLTNNLKSPPPTHAHNSSPFLTQTGVDPWLFAWRWRCLPLSYQWSIENPTWELVSIWYTVDLIHVTSMSVSRCFFIHVCLEMKTVSTLKYTFEGGFKKKQNKNIIITTIFWGRLSHFTSNYHEQVVSGM